MKANPYVGPRAFRRGETLPARKREQRELTDLLIAHRVLLLYAPSGAGKTSVINAGVTPLLAGEKLGQKHFQVVSLRVKTPVPAGRTVHNRYVYSVALDLAALDLLPGRDSRELESLTLPTMLRLADKEPGGIWVLIFDQFEEILTLDPSDRHSQEVFFHELGSALGDGQVWALLSMREDKIGGLYPFRPHLPKDLVTEYRLDFLSRDAAKEAIQKPADEQHVDFGGDAADRLLHRLSGVKVQRPTGGTEETQAPFVVPFQLQVVCRNLWKSLDKEKGDAFNSIELDDIETYGDVDGALRDYYADTVREVARQVGEPAIREWEIREWFERQLITEEHIRSQTRSNPVPWEADRGEVRDSLENAYLIRSDTRAGATWYELSHDNLIEPILESNKSAREARERRPAFHTPTERDGMLVLRGHQSPPHGVAFSPDGRQLASASDDNTVRLWDTTTVDPGGTLEGHQDKVQGVAFSPDGRQLASASDDGTVRLWDSATKQLLITLRGHAGPVNGVAFSPDGRQLASASNDGTVRLWDTTTRDLIAILKGHQDRVQGVAFSPDGRQLASGSSDHTVRFWDTATRDLIATLRDQSRVYGLAFSPDGHLLASGGRARTVRLWDTATRDLIATLEGHTGFVNGVAFSPDGHLLGSAGDDGVVRLWDPATRQPSTSLGGHTGPVLAVAFSPNARQLATGGDDHTVRLWDVALISNASV